VILYVVCWTYVFRVCRLALVTVIRTSLVQSPESSFVFLISQSQLSLISLCTLNKLLVHKIILYYNFVIIKTLEVNSCWTNLVPTIFLFLMMTNTCILMNNFKSFLPKIINSIRVRFVSSSWMCKFSSD
jgi:hypothetical protein